MKKGKWNYTEDIEYSVFLVKLHAVESPVMHWQNAFVDQEQQAVKIVHPATGREFWIGNDDGYGLLKIRKGGGPDSYSAHLEEFTIIRELPEKEWQEPDFKKHMQSRTACDQWQEKTYPESFAKMQSLRNMIKKSEIR